MSTYKSQFDKLTEAYINLKVNPFLSCNCFVGNLLNGSSEWSCHRMYERVVGKHKITNCMRRNYSITFDDYSMEEIVTLERKFLKTYIKENKGVDTFLKDEFDFSYYQNLSKPTYGDKSYEEVMAIQENALFKAFETTLNLLRGIHIAKGENVDQDIIPAFTKRTLQTV
jgi:hypothetical protein